jgi:putative glycerol-1-phosphate prenyltransferase
MSKGILKEIQKKKALGVKSLAVLVDPDHSSLKNFERTVELANASKVDYFFIGGSLLLQDRMDECIKFIRETSNIPIIIFPGNNYQINSNADAILLLSLISGRNPDYLIGKHVESSMRLYTSKLEVISTAYLLIDGHNSNTASYISQTLPIPANKPEIALATAMAGQMLNMQLLYLDAGSGAHHPVPPNMLDKLHSYINIPIIVGGGIRDSETVYQTLQAGADLIVIGNVLEEHPKYIKNLMETVHSFSPLQVKRK